MRRLLTLVVLVLMLVPLHASAATSPKPGLVNLTLKDVGEGWTLQANKTATIAEIAKDEHKTAAQEAATGSLGENSVTFVRKLTGYEVTVLGLIGAESQVYQYDTATHAKTAYQQTVKGGPAGVPGKVATLKLGAVGPQHTSWVSTLPPQNGSKIFADILLFYRGDYVVVLNGVSQELNNTAEVLQFARAIDGHIQQAH